VKDEKKRDSLGMSATPRKRFAGYQRHRRQTTSPRNGTRKIAQHFGNYPKSIRANLEEGAITWKGRCLTKEKLAVTPLVRKTSQTPRQHRPEHS